MLRHISVNGGHRVLPVLLFAPPDATDLFKLRNRHFGGEGVEAEARAGVVDGRVAVAGYGGAGGVGELLQLRRAAGDRGEKDFAVAVGVRAERIGVGGEGDYRAVAVDVGIAVGAARLDNNAVFCRSR